MSRDLATVTPEDFAPHVGRTFRMTHPAGLDEPVELVKVRLSPQKPPEGYRQQFSVEFRSAPGPVLAQGIYCFGHEEAGEFEIMVTPVQSSAEGVYYTGVFG